MNRAEMRRKAREQEKCRLPLNFKMQLGQVAGLTGQQAMILQNYLKAREDEITEQATDACIREAGTGRRLYNDHKYNHLYLRDKVFMGIHESK